MNNKKTIGDLVNFLNDQKQKTIDNIIIKVKNGYKLILINNLDIEIKKLRKKLKKKEFLVSYSNKDSNLLENDEFIIQISKKIKLKDDDVGGIDFETYIENDNKYYYFKLN